MNMLDTIRAGLESRKAIQEGADIMRDLFGPAYPIADLCQALDYGWIDDAIKPRELQYMQIVLALINHYGRDELENAALASIRADLMAGKLDAWIYQGDF